MNAAPRLLRAHFLRALVHNDLVAPRGDTELALLHALALATLPGMLFSRVALSRYVSRPLSDPARLAEMVAADRALLVTLSMLALSFVAVWAWDELLPTRRDHAALGALPLETASLLRAKAAALLGLLSICTGALNFASALVFPLVSGPTGASFAHAFLRLAVHALVVAAAAAFVGCAAVAARAVCSRAGALRLAQVVLFVVLVQSLFLLPRYVRAVARLDADDWLLLLLPPTWFFGLYATLSGGGGALHQGLAVAAVVALGASAAGCVMSYRFAAEPPAAPSAARPAEAGVRRLTERLINRFALRSAHERAAFWFVLLSLWRSPGHKLTLSAYAAVGLAFSGVLGALTSADTLSVEASRSLLLRANYVVLFFVLLGLRSAFDRPAELSANWTFRLAARSAAGLRRGARKAALCVGVAPFLLSLPALVVVGLRGVPLLLHLACGFVVAAVSMLLLLLRRRRVPLTCESVPGRANLRLTWPLYILAFFAFVSLATALELFVLERPVAFVALLAAAAVLAALARDRSSSDEPVFEVESETLSLGLDAGTAL